jgi:hypothetical protein
MLSKATSTAPRSSPRSSITDASCWAPGAAARGLRLVAEPAPTETSTDRIEAALSALVARTRQGRSDDALIALEGLATALPRPLRFDGLGQRGTRRRRKAFAMARSESRPWLEACGLQPRYRQGRCPSAGSCPASIPASAVAAPPINEARATDFLGYKFGVIAFSVE